MAKLNPRCQLGMLQKAQELGCLKGGARGLSGLSHFTTAYAPGDH